MRQDLPESHIEEAQLLESAGYAVLLTLELIDPIALAGNSGLPLFLYFTSLKEVVWQGDNYSAIPFSLSGVGSHSSGEVVRPKLLLPNAAGAFSRFAQEGWLNNAVITRKIVRTEDLVNNVNSFTQKTWKVSKVANLSKNLIVLELRGVFDGPNFKMPPRSYFPPLFPAVSLR